MKKPGRLFLIKDIRQYLDIPVLDLGAVWILINSSIMKQKIIMLSLGIILINPTFGQLNEELVAVLDTVLQEDQKYRLEMDEIEKKYGWESQEMTDNWENMAKADSTNLIKVRKILDQWGWLGENIMGADGSSALFLVIQHANLETQVEYLPMLREAAARGDARPQDLAYLEDRVALAQGERQIYGSQLEIQYNTGEMYVLPIICPDSLDIRRAEVGLPPMSEYLNYAGMTWDLEKHKARTAKFEADRQRYLDSIQENSLKID